MAEIIAFPNSASKRICPPARPLRSTKTNGGRTAESSSENKFSARKAKSGFGAGQKQAASRSIGIGSKGISWKTIFTLFWTVLVFTWPVVCVLFFFDLFWHGLLCIFGDPAAHNELIFIAHFGLFFLLALVKTVGFKFIN